MRVFKEYTNVLKKASGSWAEPYSLASLLALQRVLIYQRYILRLPAHILQGKWYTSRYIGS
ncbi:hypothetical protein MG290_13340 [Flavobacterium sp. CBA20B-1]|uniref:hypothetical protein n=1 Tax=unclassified Flavobacterium TaxID=196869 RepID=UPI0022240F26|nr:MULTISPECIES: hypothetical protein [unclassified Flavobacterium]WCM41908.1 hypothetical protein MG290_13340 [Flavobacterium sp. CBA20B-1]